MKENALKCKHNDSGVPFGYVLDNEKHYQLTGEPESAAVKEVFERYARGDKIKSILDYCAKVGVKRAALIAKDGSNSPELVRMSIDWLPVLDSNQRLCG